MREQGQAVCKQWALDSGQGGPNSPTEGWKGACIALLTRLNANLGEAEALACSSHFYQSAVALPHPTTLKVFDCRQTRLPNFKKADCVSERSLRLSSALPTDFVTGIHTSFQKG
eukprot:1159271-Pelagomonas_calceolata.AAC.9